LTGRRSLFTALHGVAGCASIEAFDFQGAPAFDGQKLRIDRADIPHDVAELVSGSGIPSEGGFDAAIAVPKAFEQLKVYGFPSGRPVSRGTQVSVANPPLMNLNSWPMPIQVRTALEGRMSPDPNVVEFLDVDGVLLPGHSGAPLLDSAERVVAMADGGLEGGKDNRSWAVPWAKVQLRPFDEAANRKLGRAPAILFAYDLETDEMPAIARRVVKVGSLDTISLGHSGYVPGLQGELIPILDSLNRTYLYARNVAIDAGKPQPVNFRLNEPLRVEDSDGNRFSIAVTAITPAGATIAYKKLPSDETGYVSEFEVRVTDDKGAALSGATVQVTFADGTFKSATSNARGLAVLTHLKASATAVIATHPEFSVGFFPADGLRTPLVARLHSSLRGGSLTLDANTGQIPGLDGRLNPIRDSLNRTYLYADNIAIAGGEVQPVAFSLNSPFVLEDSHGNRFSASVIAVDNSSSALEYQQLAAAKGGVVPSCEVSVVDEQKIPVAGADVVAVFRDGTVVSSKTTPQGIARFEHLKSALVDLYVARMGYSALKLAGQDATRALHLTLRHSSVNSGAFVGREATIPGLQGDLDPVYEPSDPYLYARGIKINGGDKQPVHFQLGETLTLQDSADSIFELRVIAMAQYAFLLEYRRIDHP
jgi:hypothetical protein